MLPAAAATTAEHRLETALIFIVHFMKELGANNPILWEGEMSCTHRQC